MTITLIAAVGKNNVIGSEGDLPWHLPEDMKFFSATTRGHHVLTGRKNYESIPEKFRPLPGRVNIVVTRNKNFTENGAVVVDSIIEGIRMASDAGENELFIIGGGEIYAQTIGMADKLLITHVNASPKGETHFPEIDPKIWKKESLFTHPSDERHNHSFETCVYHKVDSI